MADTILIDWKPGPKREVEVIRRDGVMALHLTNSHDKALWTVTHIPTGRRLGIFEQIGFAELFLRDAAQIAAKYPKPFSYRTASSFKKNMRANPELKADLKWLETRIYECQGTK